MNRMDKMETRQLMTLALLGWLIAVLVCYINFGSPKTGEDYSLAEFFYSLLGATGALWLGIEFEVVMSSIREYRAGGHWCSRPDPLARHRRWIPGHHGRVCRGQELGPRLV